MHRPTARSGPRIVALLVMLMGVLAVSHVNGAPPVDVSEPDVVVVVSAANPLTVISRLHLTDLYLGRTARFPNGSPAVPIDLQTGSPTRLAFSERYLGRTEAQLKAHWSKIIFTGRGRPPAEVAGEVAARAAIARDPRAIGYLDRRFVDSSVRIVRVR